MAWDRTQLRNGMLVYSSDGEKLGKIVDSRADGFVVEKGFFFPKDYFARYAHVAELREGEVWLTLDKAALEQGDAGEAWGGEQRSGSAAYGDVDLGRDRPDRERLETGRAEHDRLHAGADLRVPLAEEEIDVEKRMRQVGEVQVRKEVHVEHRQISVPVTREEVTVERVPASASTPAQTGDFERKTISVPVMEEEIEIKKRPVVKEEVRIRRDRVETERRADTEVRRETAEIDDTTTKDRPRTDDPLYRSPSRDDDLP